MFNLTRFLLLALFFIFMVAIVRLVAEGEWYLAGSLLAGVFLSRDEVRKLLEEEGDDE